MSPEFVFAIGTLAYWLGWASALRGVALLGQWLAKAPGQDRAQIQRGIFIAGIIAGLCFGLSATLPQELGRPKEPGLNVPIVWFVMPWMGWIAVVAVAMVATRLAQSFLSLAAEERSERLKAAGAWTLAGTLFFWLFKSSGDSVQILRGMVPIKPGTALAIVLLAFAAIFAMAFATKAAKARKFSKNAATHLALISGSIVFGIPFVWLMVTSFKEDRDMVSPDGLIWVPRVSQFVDYLDEDNPLVEATLEGRSVLGYIVEKYPDGSAKIEVDRPHVLRGRTTAAKAPLKIIPKEIPLVTFQEGDREIIGKVTKEESNGLRTIVATEPKDVEGQTFQRKRAETEPYRKIGLRFRNYSDALDYLPIEANRGLVYVKNTLILVFFNVIGTIFASSLVAYAFARMRFPGKNLLFTLLLSTMMLPGAVTLLPQFLIFRSLGWIDTLYPLWVPAFFGSAFNIFLLRQFFMNIPTELEDAAKIDGCSYFKSFYRVMLPQIKPALAVIAIWTFLGAWNNFMGPLVYVSSPEKMTISYAIQLFQGDRSGEPGLLMAFATMGMLPVLALFFTAQKYFIEGVTLSGLGGR